MKVRNTFVRESDSAICAIVESVVIWLDLAIRKAVVPPEELKSAWLSLERTADFWWYEEQSPGPADKGT